MTEIDVPDWVVVLAGEAYVHHGGEYSRYAMERALTAALGAWVVPAPALHISERCETCGDVLHASVSATSHLTLRQEKPDVLP
jgi:hypothetical protein